MEYITDKVARTQLLFWNLFFFPTDNHSTNFNSTEINNKVSPSQVLHTRTQTDGNDIRPQTAQIYNERASTDLNLVTA